MSTSQPQDSSQQRVLATSHSDPIVHDAHPRLAHVLTIAQPCDQSTLVKRATEAIAELSYGRGVGSKEDPLRFRDVAEKPTI